VTDFKNTNYKGDAMSTNRIILLIVLFALLPFKLMAEDTRKITVSGKSEITLDAQNAVIHIAVKEIRDEPGKSHSEVIKTISDLTVNLKKAGLNDPDIKRSMIVQGMETSWNSTTQSHIFSGYYSQCLIDLQIKKVGIMPELYKALSNFRGITITNTEFERDDIFEIRKAEYEKALKVAKIKAEYMAQALDAKVGKVLSIKEEPTNYYDRNSNVVSAETSGTTGYGIINITVQVIVEFSLE
jgi:uncharacterized protein